MNLITSNYLSEQDSYKFYYCYNKHKSAIKRFMSVSNMFRNYLFLILLIFNILFLASCGPDDNVVISEDYMSISYDSQKYNLVNYSMDMPDDCYETDATVENEDFLYYILPLFYDKVYISESAKDYIWLSTTKDYTDNEKFEEIVKLNPVLTYKIDK